MLMFQITPVIKNYVIYTDRLYITVNKYRWFKKKKIVKRMQTCF